MTDEDDDESDKQLEAGDRRYSCLKIVILTILTAMNYEFWIFADIFDIFKYEIPQKSKFKTPKQLIMGIFDPQK